MRDFLVALAVLTTLVAAPLGVAASEIQTPGRFGAGVQLGYPLEGITMNWFMTDNTSLQFGLALWLREEWGAIGGRIDYLWWMPKLSKWDWGKLGWYWGPGVDLFPWSWGGSGKNDNFGGLGAEVAVGIGLQFNNVPIDVNIEAVPVLWIAGRHGVDLVLHIGSVLGARYYF